MTADANGEREEASRLEQRVARQSERMRRAERERRGLLAHTVYFGALGVMFVLPIVAGAYLGSWLDERLEGFAVHWTLSMILLGVAVGAVNVYLFIRD